MQFTPYALPAIVALLAKAGMFIYARRSNVHNRQTQVYLLFLFSVSIQNLAEITFFTTGNDGSDIPPGVRLYFGASIAAVGLFLHFAVIVGTGARLSPLGLTPPGLVVLYAPTVALELLLWSSPQLVAGFERMGYTYTRVPGPHYFLFEYYTITYLGTALGLFVYGWRKQSTAFGRLQNKLLLAGLLPMVILVMAIIGLQRFGFQEFNTTATLPIAMTFFLAVTAYATHQYRLFDIEFFIPWSKVRKRKTAFYQRIQALIAEIARMNSMQKIVQSLSETLHCPVVFVGGPKPALAMAGEAFRLARFPIEELKKIDHIVVANEIAEAMPTTHDLMRRHRIAAIVPFHPHSQAAGSWMLLGERFSDHVQSPLDFKMVEGLFARLADHFLDNQLMLRSQLTEAKRELDALQHRLVNAWGQIEAVRRELRALTSENHCLKQRNAKLLAHRLNASLEEEAVDILARRKSLEEYVLDFEARLISVVLEHCGEDIERAAELLDVPATTLYKKIRNKHAEWKENS